MNYAKRKANLKLCKVQVRQLECLRQQVHGWWSIHHHLLWLFRWQLSHSCCWLLWHWHNSLCIIYLKYICRFIFSLYIKSLKDHITLFSHYYTSSFIYKLYWLKNKDDNIHKLYKIIWKIFRKWKLKKKDQIQNHK